MPSRNDPQASGRHAFDRNALIQMGAMAGIVIVCFLLGLGATKLARNSVAVTSAPAAPPAKKLTVTELGKSAPAAITPAATTPGRKTTAAESDRPAQASENAASTWQTTVQAEPITPGTSRPTVQQSAAAAALEAPLGPKAKPVAADGAAKSDAAQSSMPDEPVKPLANTAVPDGVGGIASAVPGRSSGAPLPVQTVVSVISQAPEAAVPPTAAKPAAQTKIIKPQPAEANEPKPARGTEAPVQKPAVTALSGEAQKASPASVSPTSAATPTSAPVAALPVAAAPRAVQPAQSRADGPNEDSQFSDMPVLQSAVTAARSRTGSVAEMILSAASSIQTQPRSIPNWLGLGQALVRAESDEAAEIAFNRVLEFPRRTDIDKAAAARAYAQLARLAMRRGQTQSAADLTQKAVDADQELGQYAALVESYSALAEHYVVNRETQKAEATLNIALAEAERGQFKPGAALIQQKLGDLAFAQNQFDTADQLYQSALETSAQEGLAELLADQYANLGRVWAARGDRGEAETFWRAARAQFENLGLSSKVETMVALLKTSSPSALQAPSEPASWRARMRRG